MPEGKTLRICDDLTCSMHGSEALVEEAERLLGPEAQKGPDGIVRWRRCACLGLCEKAPAAMCGEKPIAPLTVGDLERISTGDE